MTWALDGFEESFLSTTVGLVGLGNVKDVTSYYNLIADNILGGMDFVQTLHSKTDVIALSRHEMNRDISEILMENREAIIERIFRYDE